MPFASMSAVTSICGIPLGAGGMPDANPDLGLVVSCRGEDLALLCRDGGVPVDEAGEYPAKGLNAKGKWRDVKKQELLDVAPENSSLDRSPMATASSGFTPLLGSLPKICNTVC
ncbi:hypothetical protein HPP92_018285 [Vanilla planifolia]|uniref:Uncharacterized protein n=1 Tax=Vanilla planifolia TaxID=51239 RepID=A0A835QJP8_VANPL|nr:hypothetical protein HPP92_018285 [Vanilla planifolia]